MAESKLSERAQDVAADYINEVYGERSSIYLDGDALSRQADGEGLSERTKWR